jgi:hypothetical protein
MIHRNGRWLTNDENINLRSQNDWTIDLQPHTVTVVTHDDDDTTVDTA